MNYVRKNPRNNKKIEIDVEFLAREEIRVEEYRSKLLDRIEKEIMEEPLE